MTKMTMVISIYIMKMVVVYMVIVVLRGIGVVGYNCLTMLFAVYTMVLMLLKMF